MIIFKVTHIPSKKFYIGSEETITTNQDPFNVFPLMGHNGKTEIRNTTKDILYKNIDPSDLSKLLATMAEINKSNTLFIGIKGKEKPKPADKPIIEKSAEKPVSKIENK